MEPSSSSLPMFDVEQVQLAFSVAADFVAAQVANNVLVLALSTNRILRIDLDSPEDVEGTLPDPVPSPPAAAAAHTSHRNLI